ncbi:hypothetical protein WN943_003383 [Citrus x changshan-huyou]
MAATLNRQFKNICVLSGFTYGKHKEFVEATVDLGQTFVRGSQVLGIIPRVLKPLGSSSDSSTGEELVVSAYRPEPDPWTFVLEHPNNDGNSSRSKKYKLNLTLRL